MDRKLRSQLQQLMISTSLVLMLVMSLLVNASELIASRSISEPRKAELKNMLLQDCGSCHGMTMQGGLGPALTPVALKLKPRELIVATISEGRPGTPMPPWKTLLNQKEIEWIVDALYQGVNK